MEGRGRSPVATANGFGADELVGVAESYADLSTCGHMPLAAVNRAGVDGFEHALRAAHGRLADALTAGLSRIAV